MANLSLVGGLVWDGLADMARRADVHASSGVVAVTPAPDAEVLDVSGCTIIPGLIEAHSHLCWNAAPDWREVYDADSATSVALRMAGNAQRMLRAGITTVRDLGSPTDQSVALRNAIRAGTLTGPDLLVAGAPITPTGGHCWFLGGEADGLEGVRVAVRERRKAGVDWIKVMASGGNMTPGTNVYAPQFSVEELRAIVAEAHRLQVRVTAHAHGVEGIRAAVEAHVDMLEHCSFQTPDGSVKDDAVLAEIARQGIAVSPTITGRLATFRGQTRWTMRGELTRALFEAGCQVLMSTDCGIPNTPHEALAQALAVMCELADLTPVETLKLATSTSATILDLPDRGVIEAGRRADLVVVEGDPTVDIEALQRVRTVVARGEVVGLAR